ncbi:DUF2795 domain-containing protein [Geomonas sp. Red32]|uniref:DUF2795 domain-containing protein n=1 Tax=Geomonas sp. Red32 TaxID=2912856 RepID=UPI00202CC3B7|nr:DUF2795 domain-containing protein [Geomonas sp. Red32]MCM0083247.1 DUF2795 domain-containing protein [Geomonas sp. Red32]
MATRETGASSANVTKHLKGIDFPAEKQDLIKHAQQLHAEKVVIDEIQKMPEKEYNSMADVMKSFEPQEEESKSRSSSSRSSSSQSQSRSQSQSQGKSSHGSKSSHH